MKTYLSTCVFALSFVLFTGFVQPNCYSEHQITLENETTLLFPDFDEGLMRGGKSKKTYLQKLGPSAHKSPKTTELRHRLDLLRDSYSNTLGVIKGRASNPIQIQRIPRIIHQIWLGSPVPEKYLAWMTTWMNWHGWEYKLWTEESVKSLSLVNQEIYDQVTNYGQKSDILRMELLYLMGGLYIDTDFECLKPDFFEALHQQIDFYVGVEPLEHSVLRINNAIIGSKPGHPLVAKMLQDLPQHFEATKRKWALISTGPVFMTKVIYEYLEQDHSELNLFLPCSLVYPFTSSEVDRSRSPAHLVPMKETVAIHYWSKSWVKKPGRSLTSRSEKE